VAQWQIRIVQSEIKALQSVFEFEQEKIFKSHPRGLGNYAVDL
jgi:hypothetical protein